MQRQRAANAARGWFIALVVLAALCLMGGFGSLPEAKAALGFIFGGLFGGTSSFVYNKWHCSPAAADRIKPEDGRHRASDLQRMEWIATLFASHVQSSRNDSRRPMQARCLGGSSSPGQKGPAVRGIQSERVAGIIDSLSTELNREV